MKLKEKSWSAPTIQIKQRWLAGLSTWNEILDMLLATEGGPVPVEMNCMICWLISKRVAFHDQRQNNFHTYSYTKHQKAKFWIFSIPDIEIGSY